MSISSEISRISGNVSDALTAISNKGVVVPSGSNSDDLADLISQITGGGTGATTVVTTQDSHGGDIVTITTGIDISNDTVAADKLLYGYTAHNSLGQAITGTYVPSGGASVTQDANGYLVIGSGGSGGGGGYSADDVANGTGITGSVSIQTATEIRAGAFSFCPNITSISAPNVTLIHSYALHSCSGVTSCNFPALTTIRHRSFNNFGANGLTLYLPNVTSFDQTTDYNNQSSGNTVAFAAFGGTYFILPKYSGAFSNWMLYNSPNMVGADFGTGTSSFGTNVFQYSRNLSVLILRRTAGVVSLSNVNSFADTPFGSGGTGGTIYIPKTLYDKLGTGSQDYKAASNWSTIDGYGTITWAAIEGSTYETHYVDGSTIPTT